MSTLAQFAVTASTRAVRGWSLLLALGVACSAGSGSGAAPAPAQQSSESDTPTPDTLVSATMLRVLAETADEFRTGVPVFLVAAFQFPHRVLGGFPTRAKADSARAAAGTDHGVFGPYVTPAEQVPDSAPKVISVRLEVERMGTRRIVNVNPDTVDALFFSLSAYDKFVIPYYARVYGSEYAMELRKRFWAMRPPGHCWSRMCRLLEDGAPYEDPPWPPAP